MLCSYCGLDGIPVQGKGSKCRSCHAAYMREYNSRNGEKVRAKRRAQNKTERAKNTRKAWRDRTRDERNRKQREWGHGPGQIKRLLYSAKARAVKLGLPFTLLESDVRIPDCCPILGTKLAPGSGSISDSSPTIDRIVPGLGYVPGNVAVISLRANRIKNDATPEELEAVASWLRTKLK